MEKEQLYNIIEAYLDGTLSGDELSAFEQRLKSEPDLADEVQLHRKLQNEFGDAQKRLLKSKLDTLREEFMQKDEEVAKVVPINRRNNFRILMSIAAGILVLVFAIWFFFFKTPEKREIVDEEPPTEKESIDSDQAPVKEIEDPSNLAEDQTNPENPSTENESIEEIAPEENLLARFESNPALENLIAQNGSNEDFEFSIEQPAEEEPFILKNGKIDLQINGMLFAVDLKDEKSLVVEIYNNNPQDYASKKSIASYSLIVEKDTSEDNDGLAFASKEAYFYSLQKMLTTAPGLYYYLVFQKGQSTPIFTGKFEVKK